MAARIVIGVMGSGERALTTDVTLAEHLGELIARQHWVLLTGGRDSGVMAAAVRGAKRVEGSLTVGILPTESGPVAPGIDIPVFTGLGSARNVINVLTSRIVITCGQLTPGTTSEAALAVKAGRPLILLAPNQEAVAFFKSLVADVKIVRSPEEAIAEATRILAS